MLRLVFRKALAAATVCAGLVLVSAASAQDCLHCRGSAAAPGAVAGSYMGSVAYGEGAVSAWGGDGARRYAGPGDYYGWTGQCRDRIYPQPDLFYNFYAHGPCGGYPAQMYISPKPVPPHVGHTYITYQPLMPHEFMYKHHRTYHQYYDSGRGLTRAKVIWW